MLLMRMLLSAPLFLLAASFAVAGSSNSLMDVSPDGKRLLAANRDNGPVTVIDIETRKALREIAVGEHPECVAWIGNGPLALVTVYEEDKLAFIDADKGSALATIKVENEPYG